MGVPRSSMNANRSSNSLRRSGSLPMSHCRCNTSLAAFCCENNNKKIRKSEYIETIHAPIHKHEYGSDRTRTCLVISARGIAAGVLNESCELPSSPSGLWFGAGGSDALEGVFDMLELACEELIGCVGGLAGAPGLCMGCCEASAVC